MTSGQETAHALSLQSQCLHRAQKNYVVFYPQSMKCYDNSFTDFPQTRHGNSSPETAAGVRWVAGSFCLTVAGGCALKLALVVHTTTSVAAVAKSLAWTQQIFLILQLLCFKLHRVAHKNTRLLRCCNNTQTGAQSKLPSKEYRMIYSLTLMQITMTSLITSSSNAWWRKLTVK